MLKIGFVDYYLSEWHADHYPEWIDSVAKQEGIEAKVCYAYGELEIAPTDGKSGKQWCEEKGIEQCASIAEVCEKSDVIVILAPSDPQKHLEYAKAVFPYGKPTYVDKTFAPNAAEAKKIIDLGEAYHTPFFSTSALRYATELDAYDAPTVAMMTGGGRSADEYLIHQIEMVVKKLGVGAVAVKADILSDTVWSYRVRYDDGRAAQMTWSRKGLGFFALLGGGEAPSVGASLTSNYFMILMSKILHFFAEPVPPFETEQTMECMKIRDAALLAMQTPDAWVAV